MHFKSLVLIFPSGTALKFFLKTFFFRFHLFIVILLFAYLSIVYFFQLTEYELIWSSTKNLVMLILLGANTINLLLSLIINNVKIDTSSLMFRILHGLSVAIFAFTSFVSLYYLIEKFISL